MSYEINDKTLIDEMRKNVREYVQNEYKKLETNLSNEISSEFQYPLDDEIIGENGLLSNLLSEGETIVSYSKAKELDSLWLKLLNKSIICLRYFDTREPFLKNPTKPIVAYGIDKLNEYHKSYTEFESLMYGASAYYRDHIFHVIRVWLLGIFCLIEKIDSEESFIAHLGLDGGAPTPKEIGFFEYISMWTIAALCHDLGYPLEKSEQILDKTRKMMKEFVPSPNIWNNFSYSGTQDSINEYILKFISTKMKPSSLDEDSRESKKSDGESKEKIYLGRVQPKYYLKYAKSLENFQHGIISAIIVYKMLLYFLESDFNLNDDYVYKTEDARQFYIRREILRSMAAHTCPDAYNIHITTFSSLLFLCDEFQEWGRKTWNELYTGLKENSIALKIEKFSYDEVNVCETIDFQAIGNEDIITQNIIRVFERQYSLYKTTFRDGQDTAKRDFTLKKTMVFNLPNEGARTRQITVTYCLPKSQASYFKVILSKELKNKYKDSIQKAISDKLYGRDLQFEN